MKVLRSVLMFIVMVIVLRTSPDFDNWTSVIGFLLVCISIIVHKLLKIIFFHAVIKKEKAYIMA